MILTQGYAALEAKSPLKPFSFQRRDLGDHDVLIDIHYCGVCHSDIHQVGNEWGGSLYPMVPGHEIVGVVNKIGRKVAKFSPGERVGVGCIVDSCRHCAACQKSQEQYCEEGMTNTYNDYSRNGNELMQGGYSNLIVVDERYALNIPETLPLAASAPLLCAGITVYSPLKHWQIGPGTKVAIVGLGGLGHMGVKLASAMGAEVTVLSHSPKKEADSTRLGANHFFLTNVDSFKILKNYFDLLIFTVSQDLEWDPYLSLLKQDGSMIILGIPAKKVSVSPLALIAGRRRLAGSLIGGIKETQEMLDFCGQHHITADIELISLHNINEAYQRILANDVHYRLVIDLSLA